MSTLPDLPFPLLGKRKGRGKGTRGRLKGGITGHRYRVVYTIGGEQMLLYKFTKELAGKETPVLGDGGKTPGVSHQPNLAGRQQGTPLCHT